MSLEDQMAKLTAALEANTAAVLGQATAGKPAPSGETAAAKKKRLEAAATAKTEAAAKEMAEEDAAKKAAAAKAKAKPAAKKATLESVTAAYSAYLAEAADDEDMLATRRAEVGAIVVHFNDGQLRNLKPEKWAEALEILRATIAGEEVNLLTKEDHEAAAAAAAEEEDADPADDLV